MTVRAGIPASIVALIHLATQRVSKGEPELAAIALGLLALGLLEGLLSYVRTRITKRIAWTLSHELRTELHRALLHDGRSVDRRTGGDLTSLASQADEVQYMVSAIVTLLRAPLTLVGLFGAMVYADGRLALVGACMLPLTLGIAHLGGRWIRRRSDGWRRARQGLMALAEDQLRNLTAVQAYVAESSESDRFSVVSEQERNARVTLETDKVVPRAVTRVVALAILAMLMLVGGTALSQDSVDAADLLAVLVALGMAARPLANIAEGWTLYQRSDTAYQYLQGILSSTRSPGRDAVEPTTLAPSMQALAVDVQEVRISFADGASPFLPFSLNAEAGECVALTGPSGTGKTTLFRMLGRHVAPSDGHIYVGGRPLEDWGVHEIRLRTGTVHQEPMLFARTLAENLCLHKAHTTDAMLRALELASATSLLETAGGLHRPLGEGGAPLSGGEMQRLCLARAILHARGLLLLDEPTSHLDDHTAAAFVRAIQALKREHTLLIATHDARLLAHVDRVVEMRPNRGPQETGNA